MSVRVGIRVGKKLGQVCVDSGKHESLHNFLCRSEYEIGRYEDPRDESLPGLGIGMTIDDFQIAGIQHDVTESLKNSVRYSITLGTRFFR